jgi:molecular chaperone GrpE
MEDATSDRAPQSELAQLQDELKREHDLYLRTLADLANFRRRAEREQINAAQAGKREIIMPLLEVIDNFERAFIHLDQSSPLAIGFQSIYRQLLSLLEVQGIAPFVSVGERFDPQRHEAVGVVNDSDYQPDTVVDEMRRGYLWQNELLRPAYVRVAQ